MSTGASLRLYNTLHVDASAGQLLTLKSTDQLPALEFDPEHDLLLGGGSNVLLAEDIPGKVVLVRLLERTLQPLDDDTVRVRLGAGEDWHDAVRWTLRHRLCGLENLSLIPGCCGAAPIQNIGAYGVELADRLHRVEAWDFTRQQAVHLDRTQCRFAYRDSLFKSIEPHRYLITAIELDLTRRFKPVLDYAGVREVLAEQQQDAPTALDVSDAVITLRRRKLPDPERIGNAGSFFKNPVIDAARAKTLEARHQGLPLHALANGQVKASAAWMIEACGWKGYRDGDAGISAQHALVLVNHGRASGEALVALARKVRESVREAFGIELENEPRVIGSSL